MGLLSPILLVVFVVAATESQVVFPSHSQTNSIVKVEHCTASNGQAGTCHEFRSRGFKDCSYFPSTNSNNPNVARHLRANFCKNTGKEIFFCCPTNTALPTRQPIVKESCSTIRCQSNAQCVEGYGNDLTKCNCNLGYRTYQNMCIANCQTISCPRNARCMEGTGSNAPSCKCLKGYKSNRTQCIELYPKNTATQRLTLTRHNINGFGGSSSHQNQRPSRNRNQDPNRFHYQFHYSNQWRPYNG